MAVLTPVSERAAREFAQAYELGELLAIKGISAGSVNSNFALELAHGRYFLRVYEEQDRAGAIAEAELLERLAAAGVPCAAPIVPRAGRDGVVGVLVGKPAALFAWRPGDIRCQRGVTAEDARKVGAALAGVHRAGEGTSPRVGRFRYEDLLERLQRIASAPDPTLASQAAPLRDALARWTARRDPSLPRGLIHGDLFRDNVLWGADREISALLDFESASEGVLAYDVMVTVLAWCVGDALDLALARALLGGYVSVRPLTPGERAGLVAEGCAAALRFTITRITDYAMRVTDGPRVVKDWRRFAMRFAAIEALGDHFLV